MSLVTLADIKVYMGIQPSDTGQDALLTIFQEAVEQQVLNFCDCSFESTVVEDEVHDGIRADIITPHNIPIISVQEVAIDVLPGGNGTPLVAEQDYYHDENAITLIFRQTPFYRGAVRISYTHGYASVPADVKLAVYEAVKANYQSRKNNREGVASRRKQDEAEGYTGAWDPRSGLPTSVVGKLQTYRVIEFPNVNMAQRNT